MLAPAEIKIEFLSFIRNERQQRQPAPRNLKIPAAMRIGVAFGIMAAADKILVRNPDDIKTKVVEGIAETPFQHAMLVARQILGWRHGFIGIFQPPDRVQLVVEVDFRQGRMGCDLDAVPRGQIRTRRRPFHRYRPGSRHRPRENRLCTGEQPKDHNC
jgi:hypothetical protein